MYFLKTLEHLESKRHDGLYGETFLEAVADAIQGITKSLHDDTELGHCVHLVNLHLSFLITQVVIFTAAVSLHDLILLIAVDIHAVLVA